LDRHRTLQATVDWSYQLLTGDERLLFGRLSVFAGSFDLAAVEGVCAGPPLDAAEVFDLLVGLVDKSMVVADRGSDGTRYRLLETLRQFAAERLADTEAVNGVRERHLRHYAAVAQEARRVGASPRQVVGDGIFEREWDNLRAAHGWAIATADLDAAELIVEATGHHAQRRGFHELGDWAERTLELESAGLQPASTTFAWAARATVGAGDNDAAIRFAERGIHSAPQPDHPGTACCWLFVILAHLAAGRDGAAIEPAHHLVMIEPTISDPVYRWEAVMGLILNALANDRASVPELVKRLSDRADQIGAPTYLGHTAYFRALSALYAEDPRDPARAFIAAHEGVVLARAARDPFGECISMSVLAFAAVALHQLSAAEICRDAITRAYDIRHWQVVWLVIETTAGYFATAGRLAQAAVLYGHLEAHHPPWGVPAVRRARQRGLDQVCQLAECDLLMAQGADMDRDELVAYALERLHQAAEQQIEPA
jgi:hypothetical protein